MTFDVECRVELGPGPTVRIRSCDEAASKTLNPQYESSGAEAMDALSVAVGFQAAGCVEICMHTYINTYIHTYIHTCIFKKVCVYICMYVCMYVCIHDISPEPYCILQCMDGWMYVCMYVCMYSDISPEPYCILNNYEFL